MQAAIQADEAAVIVKRVAAADLASGSNAVSSGEVHRHRHGRPALRQPFFNWNAPGKYLELLGFEMEVLNILQTKMHELTEKVPIIGRDGLKLIHTFTKTEKEACKTLERLLKLIFL